MLEKELQKKFSGWLKKRGILFYKMHGGLQKNFIHGELKTYQSKKGFPDIIVFEKGKVIFVELKSEKGEIRESQKEVFKLLNKQGHRIYIFRPKHWECLKNSEFDLITFLENISKEWFFWGVERQK